ncbi:MAG: hypothetical protein JST58_15190, partial [Bacteroidetes bacterium]|nr:hypothetical protein [Bacteroidota bacterium]
KKEPKNPALRREENDVRPVFWKELRVGFGTTVVNNSGALIGSTSAKEFF